MLLTQAIRSTQGVVSHSYVPKSLPAMETILCRTNVRVQDPVNIVNEKHISTIFALCQYFNKHSDNIKYRLMQDVDNKGISADFRENRHIYSIEPIGHFVFTDDSA